MKDNDGNEAIFRIVVILIAIITSVALFGALVIVLVSKIRPRFILSKSVAKTLVTGLVFIALGFITLLLVKHFKDAHKLVKWASLAGFWQISAGIAFASSHLWIKAFQRSNITVHDLKNPPPAMNLADKLGSEGSSVVGISLKTRTDVYFTEKDRVMHTLISGSTGSGKTTLLKSLYIDACKKKQPIIIIDPKGNNKTVEEFRQLALAMGVPAEKFRLFSIINPKASNRYNPLARGTAMQIRDRLMGALEWSEQFYKNQASTWLGTAIEILKALEITVNVGTLHKMLTDKKYLDELEKTISSLPDKDRAKLLITRLQQCAKLAASNQDGLISQLKDLDNAEFGYLLDPQEEANTLDLARVIEHNEIAFFQLNVMAYEVLATVHGKLILQDLKSLASQMHGEVIDLQPKFTPVFVDEFGSFAIEGFIDFLKMCRDVKLANHLFFQSLADLDAVSPEFKAQVQANCKTKVVLRSDDPADADYWSSVAGTEDVIEQSYQVESIGPFTMKTGAGNSRNSKQMRVEHDVIKQLAIGQAVILQKAPAKEDLVNLWLPNSGELTQKKSA
jgi:hypothetical protein